jgi:hypothetical protein
MASAANSPIFIIGCHRSGTTLLRLILDAHPNISCGPETRFLADLANITADPNWQRMRLYGFPKQYWHQRIAALFDAFQSEYAHARGKVRWADKTPRYALCVDYLNELFPTCQVVHVVRDGRDVVASHRDRWGYGSALKAVKKWPWYVATARAAGARLPADRYHEVRYEDLVTDPEGTLRQLLDFLGEPWDPILLQHGVGGLSDRPRAGRPRLGGLRLSEHPRRLLSQPKAWTIPRLWQRLSRPAISQRTLRRRVGAIACWRRPRLVAKGDPEL